MVTLFHPSQVCAVGFNGEVLFGPAGLFPSAQKFLAFHHRLVVERGVTGDDRSEQKLRGLRPLRGEQPGHAGISITLMMPDPRAHFANDPIGQFGAAPRATVAVSSVMAAAALERCDPCRPSVANH